MKVSSLFLACTLLLAASNADSCGTESTTARENPDPKTNVRPTPASTPRYKASQPAAVYEAMREQESAQ